MFSNPAQEKETLTLLNKPELTKEESKSLAKWHAPFDAKWNELKVDAEASKAKEPKPKLTEVYQAKKNGVTYGKYTIHHPCGNSDEARTG